MRLDSGNTTGEVQRETEVGRERENQSTYSHKLMIVTDTIRPHALVAISFECRFFSRPTNSSAEAGYDAT